MTRPVHDPEVIARLQEGETRLVYARMKGSTTSDPLYFLTDGTARDPEMKWQAKEQLMCPVPECTDPRLFAVNRSQYSGRRDGFSHHRGAGNHAAEGLLHLQGKAMLHSWVSTQYPEARVEVEAAVGNRERVADVLVTWPDGSQVAIEIQFAAITVGAWLTRHESYLRQGVTPVWLLGAPSTPLRSADSPASDDRQGLVDWSQLHQAMTGHQAPVLWVDPVDQTICTPWTEVLSPEGGVETPIPCQRETTRVYVAPEPLAECTLDPVAGLVTPTMRALAQSLADYRAALERAEEAREEHKAQLREDWLTSGLRTRMLNHFGGPIPELLTRWNAGDGRIDCHTALWRCTLYEELIQDRYPISQFTSIQAYARIEAMGVDLDDYWYQPVHRFLRDLVRHGILAETTGHDDARNRYCVTADFDCPSYRAWKQEQQAIRQSAHDRARDEQGRQAPDASASEQIGVTWTHCRGCGSPLDDIYRDRGFHDPDYCFSAQGRSSGR
ncbi:MAG: competence protein CoiA family protein [Nocardioides sp.]